MSDAPTASRTPGRAGSHLGRADLLRRLQRLALGPEALPRVMRLVEDELASALEAQAKDSYTASEISAAGGDDDLVAKLRAQRTEAERIAAIKAAGLADLSKEQLEAVLAEAGR